MNPFLDRRPKRRRGRKCAIMLLERLVELVFLFSGRYLISIRKNPRAGSNFAGIFPYGDLQDSHVWKYAFWCLHDVQVPIPTLSNIKGFFLPFFPSLSLCIGCTALVTSCIVLTEVAYSIIILHSVCRLPPPPPPRGDSRLYLFILGDP